MTLAKHRDDTNGFACVGFMANHCLDKGNYLFGFCAIDIAIPDPVDTERDTRWLQVAGACLPQSTDLPLIRQRITKGNDLRHASEMLNQSYSLAKGLPREVVDGRHVVVEMRIRYVLEHRLSQVLKDGLILAYTQWRDLFMVTYNNDLRTHVQRDQRIDICLTRLVNDHHIKLCCLGIKALGHD